MPELPEVETVLQALRGSGIIGSPLSQVEIRKKFHIKESITTQRQKGQVENQNEYSLLRTSKEHSQARRSKGIEEKPLPSLRLPELDLQFFGDKSEEENKQRKTTPLQEIVNNSLNNLLSGIRSGVDVEFLESESTKQALLNANNPNINEETLKFFYNLRENVRKINNTIGDSENKNLLQEQQIEELNNNLLEKENLVEELRKKIDGIETKLREKERSIADKEQRLNEFNSKINRLETERQENFEASKKLENQIRGLENENQQLKQKETNDNAFFKEVSNQALSKIDNLQEQLAEEKLKGEQSEEKNVELYKQNTALIRQTSSLIEEKKTLAAENKKLTDKVQEQGQTLVDFIERAKKEFEQAKNDYEIELENKLEEQRQSYEEEIQDLNRVKEELSEVNSQFAQSPEFFEWQSNQTSQATNREGKPRRKSFSLLDELKLQNNSERIGELELKIEKLNEIIKNKEGELDSQQKTIEEQTSKIKELDDENQKLVNQGNDLAKKAEELEEQLRNKEIEDDLNQMIDENRADQAEVINNHADKIKEAEEQNDDAPISNPPTLTVDQRTEDIAARQEVVENEFIRNLLNSEESVKLWGQYREEVISNINRLKKELEKIANDNTNQNPEIDEEIVEEENSQSEVAEGTSPEEVKKISSAVSVEEMERISKEAREKFQQEIEDLQKKLAEKDEELKRRRKQKTSQPSQQNEEKGNDEEDQLEKLIKNAEKAALEGTRSLTSTPVDELSEFKFPSVSNEKGNGHCCPRCGANSNPETTSEKSTSSHSRSNSNRSRSSSFRRSGSFDIGENLQKMAQLRDQLKAKDNEIVSLNAKYATLEGEKIRLEEELDRINDNRSIRAHHSRETSDDTDISGTLEPNDFNSDDKDRKIVDLQSELEETKRKLELFESSSEKHNCLNGCCLNGDYENIKRKNADLQNQNISLQAIINEQTPTDSIKKEKGTIFPDSLQGVNYDYVKPTVKELLQQIHQNNEVDLEEYLVKKHDIKQGNGHDCGVARVEEVLGIGSNDEKQEPSTSPQKPSNTNEEIEKLKKELTEARGEKTDLELQLAKILGNKVNDDEGEDSVSIALNEEIEARQKAEDKVETLESEIARLKENLAKAQKSQQTAPKTQNWPRKNNAKPTKSPDDLQQQLANKNQQLTEAKNKAKQLEKQTQLTRKDAELEKLKRNLDAEKEKNKNSAANPPKIRTNQPVKKGQNSRTTKPAGSPGQKKSPAQQIEELNNQLQTARQERDAALTSQQQATKEKELSEKRATDAEIENSSLQTQLQNKQSELATKTAENDNLSSKLTSERQEKDQISKQLSETQIRNKELESESKSAEALQNTVEELTTTIQELENRNKEGSTPEKEQLQSQI
ncbi:3371_t:CDS:2, partial [Paraglomus occultum]